MLVEHSEAHGGIVIGPGKGGGDSGGDYGETDGMAKKEAPAAYLEELDQLFNYAELGDEAREVISSARRRAVALIEGGGGTQEATRVALVNFAAQVLNGLWLEREWQPSDLGVLFEDMAEVAELPVEYVAGTVALRALSDPALLELPPAMALDAQLGMLSTFGPLTAVSLWSAGAKGATRCVVHHGTSPPSRSARILARRALAGETVSGLLQAVPVMRWGEPQAALVGRAGSGARKQSMACLGEVASMMGPILERQALLEQSAERERALVEASERALVRLGFDLHDGPIQDLVAVGMELQAFRRQLAQALPADARERALLGRVEDIQARLDVVDRGLRELSHTLDTPTLARRPFAETLAEEVEAFITATGIVPEIRTRGEFGDLTPSQRIALLRIVHEALTNIRQHSGATEVRVSTTVRQSHVRLRVEDNGRGFDVEKVLSRRGREGRLGLAGMRARAQLLGGSGDIRSAPGGPTILSFALPRWERPGDS
jgi:signal transduction histidine kinase